MKQFHRLICFARDWLASIKRGRLFFDARDEARRVESKKGLCLVHPAQAKLTSGSISDQINGAASKQAASARRRSRCGVIFSRFLSAPLTKSGRTKPAPTTNYKQGERTDGRTKSSERLLCVLSFFGAASERKSIVRIKGRCLEAISRPFSKRRRESSPVLMRSLARPLKVDERDYYLLKRRSNQYSILSTRLRILARRQTGCVAGRRARGTTKLICADRGAIEFPGRATRRSLPVWPASRRRAAEQMDAARPAEQAGQHFPAQRAAARLPLGSWAKKFKSRSAAAPNSADLLIAATLRDEARRGEASGAQR